LVLGFNGIVVSKGLDFSSLGLGCQLVIDLAPMYSDVPVSVDTDPHLITAYLGDSNFYVMAYLDNGHVASVSG